MMAGTVDFGRGRGCKKERATVTLRKTKEPLSPLFLIHGALVLYVIPREKKIGVDFTSLRDEGLRTASSE